MELRVLRYFLAVAREESISAAAESLHMSQPTLSRQLRDLEEELGKQLIIRGNRKIGLTDEGRLLQKRAQEMIELAEKTQSEISKSDDLISGDIYIGGGETEGMRIVAKTIRKLQSDYPNIHIHLFSGNVTDILEKLDKGLLDFGILVNPPSITNYNFINLPFRDVTGLLMRKDSPLATRDTVKPEDLNDIPILASRNVTARRRISAWLGRDFDTLNIVATFNLIFNAALLVEEGIGCAICLDKLVRLSEKSPLCFRPFEPKLEASLCIVWKKNQVFSKASEKFKVYLTATQKPSIITT